jgi:L-threonylcarbamoyladenylate synthase
METVRLPATDGGSIEHAARIIRAGGLVAFPTETVYGLGANALDAATVKKVFTVKERPLWDPLIVHVNSREMLESVVARLPPKFDHLFAAFMPGPLTVVLPKNATVPDVVTAGRDTVAVRFPAHPVAQRLIAASRVPIAAPSANRFQHVSPTTAEHVRSDLGGRIEAILDAGPCWVGVESTVLELTAEPHILREGAVTLEQLQGIFSHVVVLDTTAGPHPAEGLPSPGMLSRHYAPQTRLILSEGSEKALAAVLQELLKQKTGVLLPSGWDISAAAKFDWGQWQDWTTLASRLYAGLRWLDEQMLDVIIAPVPPEEELGRAIRQRLLKASGKILPNQSLGSQRPFL